MDPEIEVGTNALDPTPAPVVEAPEAPVLEAEEPVLEEPTEPEPKPHHMKGKTPWYMERISAETAKRQQVEEQLAQERREKAEARAMLDRLQGGDKEAPKARTEEPDIDALVDARAEQKLFNADCNAVAEKGALKIDGFNGKLDILRSIGALNDEFLKDIFAVDKDNAHLILDSLANEPERANLMIRMDSRKRISELTRISDKMTEPVKPAPVVRSGVSKVPAPKPVVDAVSDDLGEMDLSNEKLDDATWSKLFNKKYGRKTA